jgi:hypothetical protein
MKWGSACKYIHHIAMLATYTQDITCALSYATDLDYISLGHEIDCCAVYHSLLIPNNNGIRPTDKADFAFDPVMLVPLFS